MTDLPLLSICIPAYNRSLWFRRGLESIAEAGTVYRSKVEIVITDDSDDQACQAIAEEVLAGWNWHYEHHAIALGMTENWNRAIALAQGRYVVILHDDDFFVSGGVGRLVDTLEKLGDQYAVLLFGVQVVDEKERVMKRQFFKQARFLSSKEALIRLFSDSSFVRFPAIAIQRSIFKKVGFFNPEWKEPCDVEMWMRLFAKYGVYCCSEVTVAYRVHSQALTMGSFHEQTVGILLELFRKLDQFKILAESDLEKCKQLFFHQYILAGAWRQLRRGNVQYFHQVMALLRLPSLRNLSVPKKWLMFRLVFGMIDSIGAFFG